MDKRFEFASRYIRGHGIEIGALHQPLQVPPNVKVEYVDRLNNKDLRNHYPEINESLAISPDIIADAETLNEIEEDKYDFCICNHVLEHMADPINALKNWLRVLKLGGILYISVPDISNPLDNGRELTSLDHVIEDSLKRDSDKDYMHFLECAKYWTKSTSANEIENRARSELKKNYSIHYHTFNKTSLERFFSYLTSVLEKQFQIIESNDNEINNVNEYIYIIEKTDYEDKIFNFLRKNINQNINSKSCDVIIPVYNAYFDFVKCLFSTLKYQNDYRIICIDDKSTDPRICDFFSRIKAFENKNIVFLSNFVNMGFIKTVNIGMEYSKNDVILLNSDTIVTNNWADKLANCAYSEELIATVTPLSNNATICSIPNFCQDNIVPEGFTVDSFASFVEKISLKQYPEIPTAVGFCMYIKRSIIKEIGYFDDVTFGKGYCEENDFCLRAIEKGYKNVLCDDTFIFHKGASSFSADTELLSKKNLDILSRRYPQYLETVARFCQANPLKNIHENIKLRILTWDSNTKKRKILYVLHNLGGGTEKHVLELIDAIDKYYVSYILKVENNELVITEINNGNRLKYSFKLSRPINRFELNNEEYKILVEKMLNTFDIDLIHVHHLVNHPLDIFDVAFEQNIPIILTLHDYYVVCPNIYLVDEKNNYCTDPANLIKCSNCISKKLDLNPEFILNWRKLFGKILSKIDTIIAPNPSVFEILELCYPIQKDKTLVIEHGHKKEIFDVVESVQNNMSDKSNKPFCIAYIGVLDTSHKGLQIFYDLAQSKLLKNKTKWMLIGTSELHNKPGYYSDLNIHVYGKYKDYYELKKVLQEEVDLVINLSLCEVFSYTLSEAWASEIPVLVSNVGALKERVERHGGGWVVDVSDIRKIEILILNIINSPLEYQIKKESIKKINLKKFEIMSKEYRELYEAKISMNSICRSSFIFSNMDLFNSISTTNQKISIMSETFKQDIALPLRFFYCIKEHGLIYTIKRFFIFLKLRNDIG